MVSNVEIAELCWYYVGVVELYHHELYDAVL